MDEEIKIGGLRKVDSEQLRTILQDHRLWLKSEEKDGRKANLSHTDLRNAKLAGRILCKADLHGADLRHADLYDTNLEGADLHEAQLRCADLRGAKLGNARGLVEDQLALTNLANAELPSHLATFDGLARVAEVTGHARTLFFSTIAVCSFSWLTVAAVGNVDLITNSATSRIPLLEATVSIRNFFLVVPLVILGLYVYLHLHLQSLWSHSACLPEVFQDGLRLDQKASPWMLNGVVHRYRSDKNRQGRSCPPLGFVASVFVAWGLVPITLLAIWSEYLVTHDRCIIILLGAEVVASVFFGIYAFRKAKSLLICGATPSWEETYHYRSRGRTVVDVLAVTLVVLMILGGSMAVTNHPRWPISLDGLILPDLENQCRPEGPEIGKQQPTATDNDRNLLLEILDSKAYADLRNADVSKKLEGWKDYEQKCREREGKEQSEECGNNSKAPADPPPVKPAFLNGWNLRGVNAVGAFLVKAQLKGADLRKARLYSEDLKTNLEGAQMTAADLRKADLRNCRLRGAYLNGKADLRCANLSYADLTGANLNEAVLSKANAQNAMFRCAYLDNARLEGTNLEGANLQCAVLDNCKLPEAKLPKADLSGAGARNACFCRADLGKSKLRKGNFTEADLSCATLRRASAEKVIFKKSILRGTHLEGANLNGAILERANCQGAFFTGSSLENADLEESCLQKTRFNYADLTNANLRKADLREARLDGANLTAADFRGATFGPSNDASRDGKCEENRKEDPPCKDSDCTDKTTRNATPTHCAEQEPLQNKEGGSRRDAFSGTSFETALLKGANFTGVTLKGVTFKGANLTGAILNNAKCEDADFCGAILHGARFNGADLSQAQNLTDEQLESVCGDEKTQPPKGRRIKKNCPREER